MSGIQKTKLGFDSTDIPGSDQVASYLIGSTGTRVTSADFVGVEALYVAQAAPIDINGIVPVSAADLDIRDLNFSQDSVQIMDGDGHALDIDGVDGSLKVKQSGSWEVSLSAGTLAALESITVSATDLDIRDLSSATDSVAAVQSGAWEVSLSAGTLAALESITVVASDLDIRNLVFADDKVDVTGSEVELGATSLAALENIQVSMEAYDTCVAEELTVGLTAVQVVASAPVANRRYLLIQNVSDKKMYIGGSGVTTATGIELPPNGNLPLDAASAVYAICGTAGKKIRILELGLG